MGKPLVVIGIISYPIVPSAGILRDDIVDSDCSDDELIDESNELSFNVKSDPMLVLPLYSTLSNDQQIKVSIINIIIALSLIVLLVGISRCS